MKKIKNLELASYKNGNLDSLLVSKFIKQLSRKDLKIYIKILKSIESKKNVVLTVADTNISGEFLKKTKNLFPGKEIIVKEDKSLIAGLKIVDFDMVYEFNLKNKIEKISEFINN